jgi:hypothetical protein
MRSQLAWLAPPTLIQPSLAWKALAGLELVRVGRQDAGHRQDAGVDVGDRVAGLGGRASGFAGDGHQAGKALRDQVEAAFVRIRAVTAVSGHRAVDQAGVDFLEDVVAQPQPFQGAAAVVLGQDVGLLHHGQQDLASLRMLQVEGDAALVAVQDHERRRHAVHARLAVAARIVAAGELFDLDHVGAHIGQHHAARGAGHDLREFEHAHAGQRTGMGSGVCACHGIRGQDPVQTGFCLSRKAVTPILKSRLP